MKIGFDHYSIAHRGFSPSETFNLAYDLGADGVQFLEPAELDPGLDPGRLASIRSEADQCGLYFEVGLPSPNPLRRGREVEPAALVRDLLPHVQAAAVLGVDRVRAYVGDRHDRFRLDHDWTAQIAATREVLRLLAPSLRDAGLKVAIETHADLTVEELLRLLDSLDPAVVGVTLDTGNLAMRLEDPVRAVERLAGRVLSTHVKDAVLAFTPRGLCWQARPVGSGVLPIREMIAALLRANPGLNLTVELHPRTYDLPIYDPSWLSFFPDLRPDGLAAIVRLAAESERRFAEGALPRPEEIEAIPWAERDIQGLISSLEYLRGVVGRSEPGST
jgi:sugar phosphate isomerase/epimerase